MSTIVDIKASRELHCINANISINENAAEAPYHPDNCVNNICSATCGCTYVNICGGTVVYICLLM